MIRLNILPKALKVLRYLTSSCACLIHSRFEPLYRQNDADKLPSNNGKHLGCKLQKLPEFFLLSKETE